MHKFKGLVICQAHTIRPCYTRQRNLQRNDDNWKTLQVAEGVSHVRKMFSKLATRPLELNCLQLFLHQPALNLPRAKDVLWLVYFNKITSQIAIDMPEQQLVSQRCEKLRIVPLFLQLATQHFVALHVAKMGCYTWNLSCDLQRNVCCYTSCKKNCSL